MDTAITTDDGFTAERYFQLVDEGAIGPDDRVELLDGVIVAVSPSGPSHASIIGHATRALTLATVGMPVAVRGQLPLVVSRYSAPEPDIAIVSGTHADYAKAHPSAARLVIEVADSSLPQDRITKARVYAGGSVPEYWIVNLRDDCVEVLSSPHVAKRVYGEHRTARRGEVLQMIRVPGVRIAVDDLLPAPMSDV